MKIKVRLSKNLNEINSVKAKNICAQLKDDEAMLYINPKTGVARIVDKTILGGYKVLHRDQTQKLFNTLYNLPFGSSLKREAEICRACVGVHEKLDRE